MEGPLAPDVYVAERALLGINGRRPPPQKKTLSNLGSKHCPKGSSKNNYKQNENEFFSLKT